MQDDRWGIVILIVVGVEDHGLHDAAHVGFGEGDFVGVVEAVEGERQKGGQEGGGGGTEKEFGLALHVLYYDGGGEWFAKSVSCCSRWEG